MPLLPTTVVPRIMFFLRIEIPPFSLLICFFSPPKNWEIDAVDQKKMWRNPGGTAFRDDPRMNQGRHGVEIRGGWLDKQQWPEPVQESCY
jgi:hypothetical protein